MTEMAAEMERSKVRYHGLDALRAWAMSMGLVLHAAWIMAPGEAGAPKSDASSSVWMDYLGLSIHTFRMQLFFVLAGFFACLLLRKRGVASLLRNRTMRIAVPLIVFWAVLCPLMVYQYNVAGKQSGAILGEESPWMMTAEYFRTLTIDSVMLMHLWFIYYLCWTYAIVILLRAGLQLIDRQSKVRNWFSKQAGRLLTQPWSALVLAALLSPLMILMDGCWGIEVGLISLTPKWTGLFSYVGYFLVGWLIYRNREQLGSIIRGWRWQLALALLLTVPYYVYSQFAAQHGYATWQYPNISIEDLVHEADQPKWVELRERLLQADSSSITGRVWKALPEENQRFVIEQPAATENQISGLLNTINLNILGDGDLASGISMNDVILSPAVEAISNKPVEQRTDDEIRLLNRELLEADLAGVLYSQDIHRPYFYPIRIAYAYGYSLMTWLWIFGCIGFSQYFFDRASRFWRYFSDASYWFYLAHLPIQFQLLIWVGDEPWPWPFKFFFYVLATAVVLWPSYHFLVRPTWIGWLLNGRTFPMTPVTTQVDHLRTASMPAR